MDSNEYFRLMYEALQANKHNIPDFATNRKRERVCTGHIILTGGLRDERDR